MPSALGATTRWLTTVAREAQIALMPRGVTAPCREILRTLLAERGEVLRRTATDWVIREALDLQGRRPRAETEALVSASFDAWQTYLLEGDYAPVAAFIDRVVRLRGGQGFRISTLQRGLLSFKKAVGRHLDGCPPPDRLALLESLDEAYEQVLFDLSDAYQAEIVRQQVELKERAERARAAQTAFLADIGHEVRTPLSSLLGFAQLLDRARGVTSGEELQEYFSNLEGNARALLELVDDLVDLGRLESGLVGNVPEDLDLWRLVEDVHADLSAEAEQQAVAYTLGMPPHLPRYTQVDGGHLARALRSVLRSALRSSPSGSEVHLAVKMPSTEQLIATISDQGSEPLAQRSSWLSGLDQVPGSRGAGPGLAVAVAGRLASLMGGTLTVIGEPGAFEWRFDIPVAPISDLTTTAPPSIPPSAPLREVLVITSDDTPIEILADAFHESGIHATFATADTPPPDARPDVVLADLSTAVSTLEPLRAQSNLQDVPIVAAIAGGAEDRDALLEAGAYDVIDKPLDIDELMGALISAAMSPSP